MSVYIEMFNGPAAGRCFAVECLTPIVEIPVELKMRVILAWRYELWGVGQLGGRGIYKYAGLTRPNPLMSATEKALNPNRFPV